MKLLQIILFIAIILFTGITRAQDFTINYQQTINLGEPETSFYDLYVANEASLYFDVTQKRSASVKETNDNNLNTINITEEHKPNHIYIDFASKALYQSTYLGKSNYVIKEDLYPFNWKITNETKQIANYICTKATTKFRGRNYEVWFTDEIPISAGPWKIHGLPGLILELYDNNHLITIQAKKITTQNVSKEQIDLIRTIKSSKTITYKVYDNLFKEHIQDLFNKMATKMPEGFSSSVKIDENCEDCQNLEMYEEWEK